MTNIKINSKVQQSREIKHQKNGNGTKRDENLLSQFHPVSHVIHTTPGRSRTWGWYNNRSSNVLSNCFIYGLLSGIYCPDRTTTLINTRVLRTGPQTQFLRLLMFQGEKKAHWLFIKVTGWKRHLSRYRRESHFVSFFSPIFVRYCKNVL